MITLENGLRNSLVILELLRDNNTLYYYNIHVGAFTNCREVGLTFAALGWYDQDHRYHSITPFTWCVYEHRNSDEIIINGKEGLVSLNGDLPYAGDSHHSYLASYSRGEYDLAAGKLADLIQEYTNLQIVKDNE